MKEKKTLRSAATIGRLLRRNLSKVQMLGFVLSNFIGLAIVISGIQFYSDIRSIWESDDSFINQDYLILNRKVTASHTFGSNSTEFSDEDISDLEAQPWVRRVGKFLSADYEVRAYMQQGDRSMSTSMFLEAIPDDFIDVSPDDWQYTPGDTVVPIIMSKDYLTLYNFGFASASGLPQLTEGMLSSMPLTLRLTSRDGSGDVTLLAHITGFSGRLNTILVPESFMEWSNESLGAKRGEGEKVQRLIVDVSSPGDVAIGDYLDGHSYEKAGEDTGAQAAYFIKLVSGLVIGIGALITLLSFFILLLSVALLMQKNRSKLRLLIMLGYNLRAIGKPYENITLAVSLISYALAIIAMLIFRNIYIGGLTGLIGQNEAGMAVALLCGAAVVAITLVINIIAIRRKVRSAFYS
ncbi:MAG: ABC transporter permease [Muribaculaceae bacterium]|nr:ABC transporter permease [Muribaculaceae bacterium]